MKELIEQYVGKHAYVYAGGMQVEVIVLDLKQSWGKLRYQISPISGSGDIWVENLSLKTEEAYV